MRRKATAKKASGGVAQGNGNLNIKAGEDTPLRPIKQEGKPTNTPTGKGLGKAGAKRLGRLLKRAIQSQEEPAGKGQASVPKTPVRFFKHQIQTEAENASKTAQTKIASQHVSQLILSVVSLCKHRGGISMAELKQTLAARGYDITKNKRRVHVVTKRLIDNVTLVRTTRNASIRLNNKTEIETTHVRTSTVKSPKPKGDLKQNTAVSKSPKGGEKSQRQTAKTPKTRAKSYKPRGKTNRQAARSHKPRNNARKPAGKTLQLKGKTRKPAGRSHTSRRKTPKARRKTQKTAGKKRRPKQPAQVQKAARKAQRTRRRQPKRNQRTYKFYQRRRAPRRRLPKTRARLKTQQCQIARRRPYYY